MEDMITKAELKNFESVLKKKYGLNIEECKEMEDWYRFKVKGIDFQGGKRDDLIDLSISLRQVNPNKSFKEEVIG